MADTQAPSLQAMRNKARQQQAVQLLRDLGKVKEADALAKSKGVDGQITASMLMEFAEELRNNPDAITTGKDGALEVELGKLYRKKSKQKPQGDTSPSPLLGQ